MKTLARLFFVLLAFGVLAILYQSAAAQTSRSVVWVLKADGQVAPAMRDYIARGLRAAAEQKAELVVIELNTPGGFIISMTEIVSNIRASRVPVVIFVTPRGGMAGSAGTLITLAGHASAMSPETIIGAASPVNSQGQDLSTTMKAKEIEALTALVRSVAGGRGPAAVKAAEDSIKNARAFSAEEALAVQLVDFIAADLPDLLGKLDGFGVKMETGQQVLHTSNPVIHDFPMDIGEQILDMLVKTDIVFLLLALGLLAILIELSAPGGWVAGFLGVTALALAVYGLGILTVNWFGAVFVILAFVLFVLDIKTTTHGALTIAGIGSFVLGSLVLFNSPGAPEFQRVSVPLVITVALVIGLSFAIILSIALKAQKIPLRMGQQTLLGAIGLAHADIDPTGQVQLNSELWSAKLVEGADPIRAGDKVVVIAVDGLHLKVRGSEKLP